MRGGEQVFARADSHWEKCPPGQIGEILTDGPSVTIGYYKNPDANRRSFTKDGWFHTGDLGAFDAKGYLRITGRKKEMIIRGGANIYPREIEEVLYQHPKVMDAAVVGPTRLRARLRRARVRLHHAD